MLRRFVRFITRDRWTPVACLWPYPDGYACYNRRRKMAISFGLTLQQATEECKRLNEQADCN